MDHVIRSVRAEEWAPAKELRLAALQDDAAPLAFLDTYDAASARPEAHWRARTEEAARSTAVAQFVAVAPDGSWSGTVSVLVENAGSRDFLGRVVERAQGHIVGVFVRPEHRGAGLLGALVDAACAWAWGLEEPRPARLRLYVHEANGRALGAYRKLGFELTGEYGVVGDTSATTNSGSSADPASSVAAQSAAANAAAAAARSPLAPAKELEMAMERPGGR